MLLFPEGLWIECVISWRFLDLVISSRYFHHARGSKETTLESVVQGCKNDNSQFTAIFLITPQPLNKCTDCYFEKLKSTDCCSSRCSWVMHHSHVVERRIILGKLYLIMKQKQ